MTEDLSTNMELILAYFKDLEDKNFFGTVELTLQGGKLAYSRELRSLQDFEMAVKFMPGLKDSAKKKVAEAFKNNSKFKAALEKERKIVDR